MRPLVQPFRLGFRRQLSLPARLWQLQLTCHGCHLGSTVATEHAHLNAAPTQMFHLLHGLRTQLIAKAKRTQHSPSTPQHGIALSPRLRPTEKPLAPITIAE